MNDIDVSTIARAANANGGGKPDFSRIRTIDGLDVRGKRVLVRVDFNVPIKDGIVGDTTRIERVLPTIKQLLAGGAKVIVLSHLGRPKTGTMTDTTLRPIADKMAELMRVPLRSSASPSACGSGTSSLVTSQGPRGPKLS